VALVSHKPTRAVWKITAREGSFALKGLAIPPRRVEFLGAAHEHLSRNSGLVPDLVRTKAGGRFADDGRMRYFLSTWVRGRPAMLCDPRDLVQVVEATARLHQASQGFKRGRGMNPRTYLGDWPQAFDREAELLHEWRLRAQTLGRPADSIFAEGYRLLRPQADEARRLLDADAYREWCGAVAARGGFCHQDIARSNLLLGPSGVKVFDLDALAVDLPARDLRKLLNRVFCLAGGWNPTLLRIALEAYRSRIPLTQGRMRVLLADMTFPHLFYRAGRKLYVDGLPPRHEADLLQALEGAIAVETSKPAALASLAAREALG
jgi:CotS family spore coat protein